MIARLAFIYEAQGSTKFSGRSGPGLDETDVPLRTANTVVFSKFPPTYPPISQSCKKVEN